MIRRVNIFVVVGLLACLTQAMFQEQMGQFDWNLRNIGEIQSIHFLPKKFAFISSGNVYGLASINSGAVQWSKQLEDPNASVEVSAKGFVVVSPRGKSITLLGFDNGQVVTQFGLNGAPSESEVVSSFINYSEDGDIFSGILTKDTLYSFKNDAVAAVEKTQTGSEFVRVFGDSKSVYLVSKSGADKYCVQKKSQTSATSSRECHTVDKSLSVEISQTQNQIVLQNEKTTIAVNKADIKQKNSFNPSSTLYNCGLGVKRSGANHEISNINKPSEVIATLSQSNGQQIGYGCGQFKGNTNAFTVVVASNDGLKVKKIDLGKSGSQQPTTVFERSVKLDVEDIKSVFVDELDDVRVLIQTNSLRTIMVTRDHQQLWKREESLSGIQEVQFFEFTELNERAHNPYFDHLEQHGDSLLALPQNLILRVKTQVEELTQTINYYVNLFTNGKLDSLWMEDNSFDANYGLKKIVVATTRYNTIFGLDSKTGNQLWEKSLEANWAIQSVYKARAANGVTQAVVYAHNYKSNQAKFIHIEPSEGKLVSEDVFSYIPTQIIRAFHGKENIFLVIRDNNELEVVPGQYSNNVEVRKYIDGLSFYKAENNEINGYRIRGFKLQQTWNIALSQEETVLKTAQFDYDPEESSFGNIVPEEKKVLFKFIDSNNIAVLSRSNFGRPHLILYIVNGVTGRILDSRTQYEIDFTHPVSLLFEENAIFVTYFNSEKLKYEFWVTELYVDHIESSFTDLLEKHWFGSKETEEEEEKYNFEDPGFVVFTEKYAFIPGIKEIGTIQNRKGVSRKNIIVITSSNQVYSVDRIFLNTRRQPPMSDGKLPEANPDSFKSVDLPPYLPVIPYSTVKYVSYFQRFTGLTNIRATPTYFESTSLIFVFGHDVFSSRVAPEKEFDMLGQDFKYPLLLLSVLVAIVAVVIIRYLAKKSRIIKIFVG